mmetsp:Transcript_136557/g.237016  ORF Transcript_136557/g.237016 Transcript_136557/m.237016 type:complete len:299 (-) Transcript_136557:588-1484(-)
MPLAVARPNSDLQAPCHCGQVDKLIEVCHTGIFLELLQITKASVEVAWVCQRPHILEGWLLHRCAPAHNPHIALILVTCPVLISNELLCGKRPQIYFLQYAVMLGRWRNGDRLARQLGQNGISVPAPMWAGAFGPEGDSVQQMGGAVCTLLISDLNMVHICLHNPGLPCLMAQYFNDGSLLILPTVVSLNSDGYALPTWQCTNATPAVEIRLALIVCILLQETGAAVKLTGCAPSRRTKGFGAEAQHPNVLLLVPVSHPVLLQDELHGLERGQINVIHLAGVHQDALLGWRSFIRWGW